MKIIILLIGSTVASTVFADVNPFMAVRDRDQWAIEQVMEHRVPVEPQAQPLNDHSSKGKGAKNAPSGQITPTFQVQNYKFQTETDQATINVALTDFGGSFLIDVTSDQIIQGWLLKRQSSREAFLKGGVPQDNPYQCRIRVDRPYIKDFGLTIYVTQDSDPAFIQLF